MLFPIMAELIYIPLDVDKGSLFSMFLLTLLFFFHNSRSSRCELLFPCSCDLMTGIGAIFPIGIAHLYVYFGKMSIQHFLYF
jgi:hypothetical protein